MSENPYSDQPGRAFWRPAVADVGALSYFDLWQPKLWVTPESAFATYGSCFAQHISRALQARNLNWLNSEPAPGRTPDALARRFNYGVFSARTANIYTAAQLSAWTKLAASPDDTGGIEIWTDGAGFRDSLRPGIEPEGFVSEAEARASLSTSARAFQNSVEKANVFVFTMGLTEGWENASTGQPYAMCPGTLGGQFDAQAHVFRNYGYAETRKLLEESIGRLRQINDELQVLLTVSPVPLTATATPDHVLLATTYSKSTLRAVAGDMVRDFEFVDYFPSYEIISAPPSRGMFFEPNLRSVSQVGVDYVMGHFFAALGLDDQPSKAPAQPAQSAEQAEVTRKMNEEDLVCEEMILDAYGKT